MTSRSSSTSGSKMNDEKTSSSSDAEGLTAIGPTKNKIANEDRVRRQIHSNSPKERREIGRVPRSSDVTEVIESGIVSRIIAARKEDGNNVVRSTREIGDKSKETGLVYSSNLTKFESASSVPSNSFSPGDKSMGNPVKSIERTDVDISVDTTRIEMKKDGQVTKNDLGGKSGLVLQEKTVEFDKNTNRWNKNELGGIKNMSGVTEVNENVCCSGLIPPTTTKTVDVEPANTTKDGEGGVGDVSITTHEILMESVSSKSTPAACQEKEKSSSVVRLYSMSATDHIDKSNSCSEIGPEHKKNAPAEKGGQLRNNKSNSERGGSESREVTKRKGMELDSEGNEFVSSLSNGATEKNQKKNGRCQDENRKGADGRSELPSSWSRDSGICSPTTDCKRDMREIGGGGGGGRRGGNDDSVDVEESNAIGSHYNIYNIVERVEESSQGARQICGFIPSKGKGSNSNIKGKHNSSETFPTNNFPCIDQNCDSKNGSLAIQENSGKLDKCISSSSPSSSSPTSSPSTPSSCLFSSSTTTTITTTEVTTTTIRSITPTTITTSFTLLPLSSSRCQDLTHTPSSSNSSSQFLRDDTNQPTPTPIVAKELDSHAGQTPLLLASAVGSYTTSLIQTIEGLPQSAGTGDEFKSETDTARRTGQGIESLATTSTCLDSNWSLGQPNLKQEVDSSEGGSETKEDSNSLKPEELQQRQEGDFNGTSNDDINGNDDHVSCTVKSNIENSCSESSVDVDSDHKRTDDSIAQDTDGVCLHEVVVDIETKETGQQQLLQTDVDSSVEPLQEIIHPNECNGNPQNDVTLISTNEQNGNCEVTSNQPIPKPPRKTRCTFKDINIQDVISLDPERKLKSILKTKIPPDSPCTTPVEDTIEDVVPTTSDRDEVNKKRLSSTRTVSFKKTHIKNTFSYHNAAFEGEVITEPSRRPSLADVVSHIMRNNSVVEIDMLEEDDNYHPYGRDSSMTDLVYGKRGGRYPMDAGKMIVWLALAIMIVSLAGGIIFMSENYNHKEGIVYSQPEQTTTPDR